MTDTTESAIGRAFLGEATTQLIQCRVKIRHCVQQLSEEQLWHRSGEGFTTASAISCCT